jgi:hypothetical protein
MTAWQLLGGLAVICLWCVLISAWVWVSTALIWLLRGLWHFACWLCREPARGPAAARRARQGASPYGPLQKAALRSQPIVISDDDAERAWRELAEQLQDIGEPGDGGDR